MFSEMGKIKKEKDAGNDSTQDGHTTVEDVEELSYEQKVSFACTIADPMANKKLTKKCYKLIKKASHHKTFVRNGLKDVQKRIRLGEKGIVVFAADVSPVDIMIHLPAVCEEKDIPYCFVPSRTDLGAALGSKKSSLMALVREKEEYKDAFDEVKAELKYLSCKM